MSDSNPTDISANEAHIAAQLREHGQEALATHFAAVQNRLKRIVSFRLNQRLSGRVSESDVIQETYVRAAKRIDHFLDKPEMPFLVWLRLELQQKLHEIHRFHFGAAKRDIRQEFNPRSFQQDPAATSMCLAAHLVAQITSPSLAMIRDEQVSFLHQSLASMNELDREVIALRHFEELSNVETAKVLGIETSAASKRYLRALNRFGEIMAHANQLNPKGNGSNEQGEHDA